MDKQLTPRSVISTPKPARVARASVPALFGLALFAVYIILILLHRSPPSLGDFGDLTYQGSVLHRHMVGASDPFHIVKHYPVPDGLVSVAIAVSMLFLSWAAAAKAWLCCQLLLSWAALRFFLRTADGSPMLAWIAPTAIFFNLNFWYGFLNFELSLCWALVLAAVLLHGAHHEWQTGALLTLGFFSHMVPFAFMALMVIAYAWQHRRIRLLWQLLPPAILSTWYLVGRFHLTHNAASTAGMVSSVRQFSAAFWLFKLNSFLKSLGFVNLGTRAGSYTLHLLGEPVFVFLLAVNLVLCAALGWALFQSATAALRQRRNDLFLWLAALVLLPVYLLAPGAALGIADPGSRVLQAALAVCLLLCSSRRALQVAAACTAVLALSSLVLFITAAYTVPAAQAEASGLPALAVRFAHVPNHDKDEYLDALRRGDTSLAVFPTGLLLNTPKASRPASREQ